MSEFTKGKWTAEAVYGDHWVVFDFDDERTIADCFSSENNARLIATAPEMYRILQDLAEHKPFIVGMHGICGIDEAFMDNIRRVLKRIDNKEASNG